MSNAKSKLSCLLSVCLLMGSCSGEVSTRAASSNGSGGSGTTASTASTPSTTASTPSTSASTPSTSGNTPNTTSSTSNNFALQQAADAFAKAEQERLNINCFRGGTGGIQIADSNGRCQPLP